ncbi:LacI family DNA-binding transcriptional regulator [Enterococcus sp. BWB1-3]|uniref:LacI family DNA-binding transcriptional regulator n=1 Tax=Enterococcus sp. BWB1-3 TaxID=2787713 RepID=UPI00192498AB|nr:LacI family DNA-binding transcriptional regulator [Enterococcus sp. BWB1-3]MBL1228614.1 LacI family DNA-binding transcriptional regulator [Enterococcus sp. BWB1-3]
MITIKGIAKEAGVSKSTVSRYLNNGYVSKETAEKIEKIIQKHNYSPNEFARNLKSQKSNFTGVILPRINSPSAISTLVGLERKEREYGRQLLMVNTELNINREIESLHNLEQNKVAGIILMATAITERHIETIKTLKVPVLVLGQEDERITSLTHNNYQAGIYLAEGLLQFGHQKIVYVGVTEQDIEVGVKRKAGVIAGFSQLKGTQLTFLETGFEVEDAFHLGYEELQAPQGSLYIAATDNIAIGLMKAAHRLGITIGETVSVAGFGGYSIGDYVYPSLTTIDLHHERLGALASDCMEKLIYRETIDSIPEIPIDLLYRDSVGYFKNK